LTGSSDPGEQAPLRHRRVPGSPPAQVVTVGINECRPAPGRADDALGLGCSRVRLDGVRPQIQPSGAFQQAGALIEQIVDRPPPLRGRLRVLAVPERRPGAGQAGAARGSHHHPGCLFPDLR